MYYKIFCFVSGNQLGKRYKNITHAYVPHLHGHMHMHTHTYTRTHTHSSKHTHTHALHTQTHTHTHIKFLWNIFDLPPPCLDEAFQFMPLEGDGI